MQLKEIAEKHGPFVAILIGPPLSGKDTVLRQLDVDFRVICRDDILLDVHGSDDYTRAYKEVNQKKVDELLNKSLVDGGNSEDNCIVNMTNMGTKRRKHNLSFFKNHYKVAIIFPILEDKEYERRNAKRQEEESKFIPMYVIKRMIGQYQPIAEDEGFDKVISL